MEQSKQEQNSLTNQFSIITQPTQTIKAKDLSNMLPLACPECKTIHYRLRDFKEKGTLKDPSFIKTLNDEKIRAHCRHCNHHIGYIDPYDFLFLEIIK